jgi:hypothetical protein
MTRAGKFTRGNLVLLELGFRIPYKSSTFVFLQSADIGRFVAPYNGERTAMVNFTHEADIHWLAKEAAIQAVAPPSIKVKLDKIVKQKSADADVVKKEQKKRKWYK